MEKILRIEDREFIIKRENPYYKTMSDDRYGGFEIITDLQTIQIGISDESSCCEQWGHIITNDNVSDFIGAELLSIHVVDCALNNKKLEEIESLDEGGAMFVNLETSKGTLQFVVYNSHNGYYGHNAVLISKQLNHDTVL